MADLTSIQKSLDAINERLERLEAAAAKNTAVPAPRPDHPSLDKFSLAEAIADELLAEASLEKACTFEPNGRLCDHCSMCSSRGF